MTTTFLAIATGFVVVVTVAAVDFFVAALVTVAVFVAALTGGFVVGLLALATGTGFTTVGVAVFAAAVVLAGEGGVVVTEAAGEVFATLTNRPDAAVSGEVLFCCPEEASAVLRSSASACSPLRFARTASFTTISACRASLSAAR